MAGYSGTPLPQKLGIKTGLTVVTINAPAEYRRLLGKIPHGVTFSDRLKPGSNFVHLFTGRRNELKKDFCNLLRARDWGSGSMRRPLRNIKYAEQLGVNCPHSWVFRKVFTLNPLSIFCCPTPLFMCAIDRYHGRGTS